MILTHCRNQHQRKEISELFDADEVIRFEYGPKENLYSVFRRMARLVSSNDILISNDGGMECRMVNALRLSNPLVYILHGDFEYYYQVCETHQHVIDAYIVYSRHMYNRLEERLLETNRNRISLIYYPVEDLLDGANRECTKSNERFKVLFAGSLEKRKGADVLYGIYREINAKIPSLELTICGDGELRTEIKQQFQNNTNVNIKGWLSGGELRDEYKQNHVFLFPTLKEGMPNVLVEALSHSCIPVTSNIESGIPEIIEHGKNGYLVAPGCVPTFAKWIVYCFENSSHLKVLAEHSTKKLQELFSPNKQTSKYEEMYQWFLGKTPKRTFHRLPVGGILNQSYLPNSLVTTVRRLINHPKV